MKAAQGDLPKWAIAGNKRRKHIQRVAKLMAKWSRKLGMSIEDQARWTAAATLHDALRDAKPSKLRPLVDYSLRNVPDKILHGPAAAARLADEGVLDEEVLLSVAYHTLGHPELTLMGRCLCVADFAEPGRPRLRTWRDELLKRMPRDPDAVVRDVFRSRIRFLVEGGHPIHASTVGFWNRLAADQVE